MPPVIISRAEARAKGLKRFFTGDPCIRGHINERYVSGSTACVECARLSFIGWYEEHPEHFAAKARRRRQKNPDAYKANYDQWLAANYDRKLTHNRNYRARRAGAGSHTTEETDALFDRQNGLCANPYCGTDLRIGGRVLDHVIALARSGSNGIDNLQWLCEPCNRRKYALDLTVWLDREAHRVMSLDRNRETKP